jgi:glycosyltransferase involved in cell wall biosynthesis
MLSIIIPSKNEQFLDNTILDVLENATGEIEVFAVLDGYDTKRIEDKRVKYIKLPETRHMKKRHGVNEAVKQSKGTHIMSLDAHCLVAKGFDEVLTRDCEDNMVMIPRRHRLDAENWCIQQQSDSRPPIDYEYIMWPNKHGFKFPALHGFKWDKRSRDRAEYEIDDTMTCQASCWVMTRKHFDRHNFMQIEGYTGWGQEAEEICLTTWLTGGRVVTNKRTYYAHLHKGAKYGRGYFMRKTETHACYKYSYDFWINNRLPNRIHDFKWYIEKFWPLPGWPEDWESRLGIHNK